VGVVLIGLSVASCVSTQDKAAWDHYDACQAETKSFVAMVDCGKQRRTAYCQPECSRVGDAAVQYADVLADSVRRREMTETQARLKWVEYKTTQLNAANQQAATMAVGIMASTPSPRTCTTIGNVTNCF
jgi:hypothetical protein